jgi:hypothetical protein
MNTNNSTYYVPPTYPPQAHTNVNPSLPYPPNQGMVASSIDNNLTNHTSNTHTSWQCCSPKCKEGVQIAAGIVGMIVCCPLVCSLYLSKL